MLAQSGLRLHLVGHAFAFDHGILQVNYGVAEKSLVLACGLQRIDP